MILLSVGLPELLHSPFPGMPGCPLQDTGVPPALLGAPPDARVPHQAAQSLLQEAVEPLGVGVVILEPAGTPNWGNWEPWEGKLGALERDWEPWRGQTESTGSLSRW